jgi:hypothetical protein
MSDNQAREAAQRVIEAIDSDTVCIKREDLIDVCRAWLAEHPADDEQSIDTKWLLSLGFEWNENETSDYLWVNNPKSGNKFDFVYLPTSCVWLLSDEINELTLDVRTRGDVRRLCRALRVELGEKR